MKTKLNFFIIILTLCVCFGCKKDKGVACFNTGKTTCNFNDCEIEFDATCSTPNSDIVSYKWDFDGDGIFSPNGEEIVTHTYQTAGTYQVKLQIQLANGTIAETMQTIQVNSIISNFEVPEGIIYQGCEITFNNSSQGASSYLWNFGDGVTLNEENPVHKYTKSGTYTVSLTSTLETETQKTTQTINITPSIKFEKTFASGYDYSDVIIAADGGYLLAGYTISKGAGGFDAYLIKTDANGNLQWDKTFGGSENDYAFAIEIAADGGYLLAGSTSSKGAGGRDAYLIKTDANGNFQWDKTFGGSDWDYVSVIEIASDGGYLLAGETRSKGAGGLDAYLIKTDANGNLQWDKTFGGAQGENAYALTIAPDGGYVLAGYTTSKGAGTYDAYLIKTDSNGNLQWDKTFGGAQGENAYALTIAPDEGYVLAGYTTSKGAGGADAYLIKTDSNGSLQWEQTFGANEFDEAKAIAPTNDCGYIIAGRSNSEFYLLKTDSEGNIN